jgi:RNA polymerase sigma-70 factor (ECF subfamily)
MTETEMQFEAVLRQHQTMVFSIAYHIVHDRALAEEIAQDVFLQFYRTMDFLKSPDHVTFWLRRVAAHRSIDCARRRSVMPELPLEDVQGPVASGAEDDPMLRRRLLEIVASLPEKARAVVVLRYQQELEPREIAATLDMPLGTIKSHLQRALAMLRDKVTRVMGDVQKYANE